MGLTAAERQRRSRKHRAGDHSLCDQSRCHGHAVTPDVTQAVTSRPARDPDLGTRGRRLWQQVANEGELKPGDRVLLEEACRTADRLDVLDRILRGDDDAWMRLHSANEDGSIVKVVLNNALAEARQQQVALKQLLAELRQSRAVTAGKPGDRGKTTASSGGNSKGGGGVADLAARIAARRAQTAG